MQITEALKEDLNKAVILQLWILYGKRGDSYE